MGGLKMAYRTKTYIAGDWTGDKEAIDKLYEWNNSGQLGLSFFDAHELAQARDNSLNCSIKKSLKTRIDVSKTFVLIVGNKTDSLTAGSCQFCGSYNSRTSSCQRKYSISYKSYIQYECDEAVKAGIKIIVLHNSLVLLNNKCPTIIRNVGIHIPMIYKDSDGKCYWNYDAIKKAIMG